MTHECKPHIVIESNIPFVRGLLDDVARVSYLAPEEITAESMRSADAFITRTRTRCDEALLADSQCQIIASATIGLDHVDVDYCQRRGIVVANAPGCNAPAVAQYVLASVIAAYGEDALAGLTIGIVGVGHVGKIVEQWARQLGMTVMLCDPPRAEVEGVESFVSLHEIASQADIITFHTPLTKSGRYATFHLADERFFEDLRRKPMIINAARGPVVDTQALLDAMSRGLVGRVAIDCWEGEPCVNLHLLERVFIATPHIAGYSHQGKVRATKMAVDAVAAKLGLTPKEMSEEVPLGAATEVDAHSIALSYNPLIDTENLRSNPNDFESLRNHYNLRNEVGC